MNAPVAPRGKPLAEWAMAACVVAGIAHAAWFLWVNRYLPPPFFYEPDDTYADWFNTAYWAHNPGAYDVWKTLYPPISFVFIRLFGIASCYPDRRSYDFSAGLAARDCDWVGLAAIWVLFALNFWLVWRVLSKRDRATAVPRTICLGLGLPMIDAVERGNLVLVAFACVLLGLAPLLRSARLRWLAIAMAVNFKVYLIAAFVPLLARRKWRWVEGALIATALVYLATFALQGEGAPWVILDNIREWANEPKDQILNQWYTTTYQPLLSLIREGVFPLTLLIGSRNVELVALLLPLIQHAVQGAIVMAFAATALRPEAVPSYRVVNLGILLALITSEPGGYSMMFFTLFTLLEPWRGFERRWAIGICYVLAIPADLILDRAVPLPRDTYLGGGATIITYYVTAGPFVRPLLILSLALALAVLTMREVLADVRRQGWAGRWRLRHDAPLLPWVARPVPPQG